MKTIAFDVNGTLLGHSEEKVVKLFKWFQSKGCDLTVWSSEKSYTEDALKKHNLTAKTDKKFSKTDADNWGTPLFSICVDDEFPNGKRCYLAAEIVIHVGEIPEDESQFSQKFGHLV